MAVSQIVAGLGVEPSLQDYEPHVQPYTTPREHLALYQVFPERTNEDYLRFSLKQT